MQFLNGSQENKHQKHDTLTFSDKQEIYHGPYALCVQKNLKERKLRPLVHIGYNNTHHREGYQSIAYQLFVPFTTEFSLETQKNFFEKFFIQGRPVVLQTIAGTGTGLLYHHPDQEEDDIKPFCALRKKESDLCQELIKKSGIPYFLIGKERYFIVTSLKTRAEKPLLIDAIIQAADINGSFYPSLLQVLKYSCIFSSLPLIIFCIYRLT
jgi:hypothetical protein